jgi:hypothetical protein
MLNPRTVAATSVALLAGAALAALPSPAAAKTTTCKLTPYEQQHMGVRDGYVTSLRVRSTSCARGKDVVRRFQKCRRAHGGPKARCPKATSILGYHCTENRSGIPTQYSSRVTCAKGTARVIHDYTQFT